MVTCTSCEQTKPKLLLSYLIALGGCEGDAVTSATQDRVADAPSVILDSLQDAEELVYAVIRQIDDDGTLAEFVEFGELGEQDRRRVARPWLLDDSGYLYGDRAWTHSLPDGGVEHGYVVTRMSYALDAEPEPPPRHPVRISPSLSNGIKGLEAFDTIEVYVTLRDFPMWDIPLLPNPATVGVADYASAIEAREDAIEARKAVLAGHAESFIEELVGVGGEVQALHWTTGSVRAKIAVAALQFLYEHPKVAILSANAKVTDDPDLGPRLGDQKVAERLDAARFLARGYDGSISNPFTGDSTLTMAVIETQYLGDDADTCMLHGSAECGGSRVIQRWRCLDTGCSQVNNYPENPGAAHNHGNRVMSAAMGDYQEGQLDRQVLVSAPVSAPTRTQRAFGGSVT